MVKKLLKRNSYDNIQGLSQVFPFPMEIVSVGNTKNVDAEDR
jgi:hypothetical protein